MRLDSRTVKYISLLLFLVFLWYFLQSKPPIDENQPTIVHPPVINIKRPVKIIVQECCRSDLIEMQFNLFKKFLDDPFELYLVLSRESMNTNIGTSLIKKSKELGFNISHCPHNSLSDCYDFSYGLIRNFNGYAMFANSDMFLWNNFSVNDYMKNTKCPIAAVYEVHGDIYHLHPGLHIVEPRRIPRFEDISWKKSGSDVGGETRFWISQHPEVCIHPMLWSRGSDFKTLSYLRLIPIDLLKLITEDKGTLKSDLYLEGFEIIHPRGGSNWQGDKKDILNDKFRDLFIFLNDRLDDVPLKWSSVGSAAIVDHNEMTVSLPNVKLMKNSFFPMGVNTLQSNNSTWLSLLFEEADRLQQVVKNKKIILSGEKLPLPREAPPRTNIDLHPARYDQSFYKKSTVYYWKYVYNNDTIVTEPEFTTGCEKLPNQKYWVATWGSGEKREQLGREKTIPSCKSKPGIDETIFWTTEDLDPEYVRRNSNLLNQERGAGLWMWKHYVLYMMLERMNENDILFYLDSDMMCSDDTVKFFCLANKHDITPFHHNNKWYTLSRLARRDAMIFMDLDYSKVAKSVQYSGGNVFVKKTPYSVKFIREMAAWSQQSEVIMGWRLPSEYGVDWPEYLESNMMHQCDQAISSLMHVKYGHKSYPWRIEGFGSGSDDPASVAERREAGIPKDARLIVDLN